MRTTKTLVQYSFKLDIACFISSSPAEGWILHLYGTRVSTCPRASTRSGINLVLESSSSMIGMTSLQLYFWTSEAIASAWQESFHAVLMKYGVWLDDRDGLFAEKEMIGTDVLFPSSVRNLA
uniref:Uncharacterized protein n=1 Tax=Zea mays TaxID=4577 RepID=C4J2J0_MAIZE|nr:unknown [Zea mays]